MKGLIIALLILACSASSFAATVEKHLFVKNELSHGQLALVEVMDFYANSSNFPTEMLETGQQFNWDVSVSTPEDPLDYFYEVIVYLIGDPTHPETWKPICQYMDNGLVQDYIDSLTCGISCEPLVNNSQNSVGIIVEERGHISY